MVMAQPAFKETHEMQSPPPAAVSYSASMPSARSPAQARNSSRSNPHEPMWPCYLIPMLRAAPAPKSITQQRAHTLLDRHLE